MTSNIKKRTTRIQIIIILGLLLFLIINPQESYARTISIEQAVVLALKNNESYLIARSELEKAEADVGSAVSGALPDLRFNSNYTRNLAIPEAVFNGQSIKLGTTHSTSFQLTLEQPIWKGGKVLAALKIAKLYHQYIREMVREAEGDVRFNVRQAFLSAVLVQNFVAVYEDAVGTAELNFDITRKMFDQGVVPEYELLRSEVELANLKPQLITARNQVVITQDYLKSLIGLTVAEQLDLVYEYDPRLLNHQLDLNYINSITNERRALIAEQEHLQKISKKAIGIAKAEMRPNISAQGGYGWTFQSDKFDFNKEGWTKSFSLSLLVSMPIFDGFATKHEVKKARLDHHNTELRLSEIKKMVALQVKEAFLNYLEVNERLAAQEKTVEQADEGLRIARLRYKNGIGRQLEVLSAHSALTLAKTNYVQATHDAAIAVYKLIKVTGVDDFEQLKEK